MFNPEGFREEEEIEKVEEKTNEEEPQASEVEEKEELKPESEEREINNEEDEAKEEKDENVAENLRSKLEQINSIEPSGDIASDFNNLLELTGRDSLYKKVSADEDPQIILAGLTGIRTAWQETLRDSNNVDVANEAKKLFYIDVPQAEIEAINKLINFYLDKFSTEQEKNTEDENSDNEELEIEKDPGSQEKLEPEEETNFVDENEEQSSIDNTTKDSIDNIIQQETDQKKIEFAQFWFKEHKDEIKEKGYDIENNEDSHIIEVVYEMGGFKELDKKEEYEEAKEEINDLDALKADIKKNKIPLERQVLILDLLNGRAEKLEVSIEVAKKETSNGEAFTEQQELDELFTTRKELSEQMSNRDLTQEAEDKIGLLENKKDYIDKKLRKHLTDQEKKLLKMKKIGLENIALSLKKGKAFTEGILNELGYTTQETGRIFRRIEIKDGDGNVLAKVKEENVPDFLIEEQCKIKEKEEEERWEIKNKERQGSIKEFIEQEIDILGQSPERRETAGYGWRVKDGKRKS